MIEFPSFIMGFREGLEAFLLIAIVLKYIIKIDAPQLRINVLQGAGIGVVISIILGLLLNMFAQYLGGVSTLTKLWESGASLVALLLVSVFIVWMINHGSDMSNHIKSEVDKNISAKAIFWIALIIIAREGTEIAIFAFAGKYPFDVVSMGIISALLVAVLVFYSILKVNLSLLFKITLAYLILQAGFLLGYSIHEGLSAFKGYGMLNADNLVFDKAFNFSKTILSHKDGILGIPLHVLFGWYSKPEWIQFTVQYLFTALMFTYWYKKQKIKVS